MKQLVLFIVLFSCSFSWARPLLTEAEERRLQEVDKQIAWVWKQCEKKGVKDYDSNGKINCCDAAIAFCNEWKNTYCKRIRLCQQQTVRMNHMYVQIYIDDIGWWSVDPRYTVDGTHDMGYVWSYKYSKNADDPEGNWVRYYKKWIE